MKKQIKIVSIMLVIFMVVVALSNTVSAVDIPGQIATIGEGNSSANADKVVSLGATIVTIMQTVRCSSCSSHIINTRY